MSADIKVKELKDRKTRLEKDLFKVISDYMLDFYMDTGYRIDASELKLEYNFHQTIGEPKAHTVLCGVRVQVTL